MQEVIDDVPDRNLTKLQSAFVRSMLSVRAGLELPQANKPETVDELAAVLEAWLMVIGEEGSPLPSEDAARARRIVALLPRDIAALMLQVERRVFDELKADLSFIDLCEGRDPAFIGQVWRRAFLVIASSVGGP